MNPFTRFIHYYTDQARLLDIDFHTSWLSIFFKQKKLIGGIICYILIDDVSLSLFPVVIGKIIEGQRYIYLIVAIALYLSIEIAGWFTYHPMLVRLFTQTTDSFRYNAYKFFLSIDPVDHFKKPTGITAGKIQRTTASYLEFTDAVIDEALPIIIETSAVIVMMLCINVQLGIIVAACIFSISLLFILISAYFTHDLEHQNNIEDDRVNHVGMESIYQYQFIRSTFSTDWIRTKLFDQHKKTMTLQLSVWLIYRLIRGFFIVLYLIALGFIVGYLMYLIRSEYISKVLAASLVMMYLRGTKGIFSIDKRIKTILRSYRRIKDFYVYARSFGRQTFPVYDNQGKQIMIQPSPATVITIDDVSFDYDGKLVFERNSFMIDVAAEHKNKLFGIIGPSGIGKTTILSILGGQIKPQEGHVYINGIDIYTINDHVKRKLIAVQGQFSTTLKGSLRYNLTFGLAEAIEFSDHYLISLLNNVGLWQIFEDKGGLSAEIGEAGMSLSGGQRQRLNFANLYLRATYYEPLVILIDEPTSSLDELSESAITKMISELAQKSVTFVIAHRLRTLNDAERILDLSIPAQDGKLIFYTKQSLLEKSFYYKQLLDGREMLE